jgi:hypothetical protein
MNWRAMNNILLLEDLPEIRAWLKSLVLQVFPHARITECSRVQDALLQLQSLQASTWRCATWACPTAAAPTWWPSCATCSPRRSAWWSPSTTTTSTCSRRCRPAPSATS